MHNYCINLHAHTIFSDGVNSPLGLALLAKELDFVSLVLTDHFYYGRSEYSADTRERLYQKAVREAKSVLPVIVGIELNLGLGEEVLVFGSSMINAIQAHNKEGLPLTIDLLASWKQKHQSAFILCHPRSPETWTQYLPILDGYEEYNSGHHMFLRNGVYRERTGLEHLPRWCNSDAHNVISLYRGYNTVHSKLDNENDLIRYIRSGKQPTFVIDID